MRMENREEEVNEVSGVNEVQEEEVNGISEVSGVNTIAVRIKVPEGRHYGRIPR